MFRGATLNLNRIQFHVINTFYHDEIDNADTCQMCDFTSCLNDSIHLVGIFPYCAIQLFLLKREKTDLECHGK